MKFQVILSLSLLSLVACAPTVELQKARMKKQQTVREYSPLSGYSRRVAPVPQEEESEQAKNEDGVPIGMVVSYSPLTGKTTYIPKNDGQTLARSQTPSKSQRVVSYSPLTGESVYIPRPSPKGTFELNDMEFFEAEG